jgi:hypothetical protein
MLPVTEQPQSRHHARQHQPSTSGMPPKVILSFSIFVSHLSFNCSQSVPIRVLAECCGSFILGSSLLEMFG